MDTSRRRRILVARAAVMAASLALAVAAFGGPGLAEADTRVPGHSSARYDRDGNGIPDAGVYVNGHYTSIYAYDAGGDWYWDLGDGCI